MKSDNCLDIFFLGDTYFGEWHMRLRAKKGQSNVLAEKGYLHFARQFNALLNEGDLVIANLECAITDIPVSPFAKEKRHVYAADGTNTVKALKSSNISAVTLANNHAVDFGKAGLIDTLEALEENNIRCIGGGRNISQARAPLLFAKKVGNATAGIAAISCYNYGRKSDAYGFYAAERVPGVNPLDLDALGQETARLKNQHPELMITVMPHWGPNYAWRTFTQQEMAEKIIKAGAELIIGHSAHMMQEIECIRNRLVAYGIGNFILNGNGEYQRRNLPPYSFIARLRMEPAGLDTLKKTLLFYPFVSDNLGTDFTPRFVNEAEFEQVAALLRFHSFSPAVFDALCTCGSDAHGRFLEYAVPETAP